MGLMEKLMPEDIMETIKEEVNKAQFDMDAFGTAYLWVGENEDGEIKVTRIDPCGVRECLKQ